ncbi:MAG: hypothetical protein ABW032_10545, partial [Burkholderiaceae bacterium]
MVGLYEGRTTDTGAYCAFEYGDDGVAYYFVGAQAVRVELSLTSSGAVFEKKAANNAAGFAIDWSIGIASGRDMELWFQSSAQPVSAGGLLIKPESAALPACLVTD